MTDSGGNDGFPFFDPFRAVQSLFVDTNFEGRTHQEMIRMLDAADPGQLGAMGEDLTKAATNIEVLGDDVKTNASPVEWEGEGADAFRTWTGDMSSATLRLAAFTRTVGQAMKEASVTLGEVKRDMPPYSEASRLTLNNFIMQNPGGLAKLDGSSPSPSPSGTRPGGPTGPTQSEATAAQQQLEADHGEAVRQMRKLAQSYTFTDMTMNSAERPTFPPMPGGLMPPPSVRAYDDSHIGVSSPEIADSPGRTDVGAPTADGPVPAPENEDLAVGYLRPVENTSMTLDGGVALPEAPRASGPHLSTPGPASSGQSGPMAGPVGPGTPRQSTQRIVGQGGQTPPGKGGIRPPAVGSGGQSGPPGTRGGSRMPPNHGNGIYGGRPIQTGAGQPTHGLPRGSVAGAEPTQNQHGRPPVGRAMGGGGIGGAGGGASSSGITGGRPLATTPGGRVGSPASPGVTGGRPFTPGGSGLVRGGGESSGRGFVGRPPTTNSSPREERRQDDRRPDYLVEDEETWQFGDGTRNAPPVIE